MLSKKTASAKFPLNFEDDDIVLLENNAGTLDAVKCLSVERFSIIKFFIATMTDVSMTDLLYQKCYILYKIKQILYQNFSLNIYG